MTIKAMLGRFTRFMLAVPADARRTAANRLNIVRLLSLACFMGIGIQVLLLSVADETRPTPPATAADIGRGNIIDRNGHILATDIPAIELSANPSEILYPVAAANKLAQVLRDRDATELYPLLTRDSRFVELAWRLAPEKYAEVLALGIPGLYGRKRPVRVYPNGEAAAHLLGAVDKDNVGIAGIELGMEEVLAAGGEIQLSIDINAQAILRQEMLAQIANYNALGGAAILMDIDSGEVIAMLSLPDYDANYFHTTDDNRRFNRATKGVYEMGSAFKVLNTAIALESGQFTSHDTIDVVSQLVIGDHVISDYHPEDKPLTVAEVLVVSSNKGAARIAEAIGGATQRYYFDKLGMLAALPLEVPEIATPLLPSLWETAEVMTISYGHGISVTPVHLIAGIASASSGLVSTPSLLKQQHYGDFDVEVFSPTTTSQVRAIMRQVVNHPQGTANLAETPASRGYLVAGKTGTAEKITGDGGYNRKANLTSFVGVFPAHAPRYALLTMIDEPQPQTEGQIHISGGQVAAPVAGRIIQRVAPILGVAVVDASQPHIHQALTVPLPRLDEKEAEGKTAVASGGEANAAF